MFNYHSEVFKKCFCGNSKQSIFLNKSFSEEINSLRITGGSRSAGNQQRTRSQRATDEEEYSNKKLEHKPSQIGECSLLCACFFICLFYM